jgi:hypothetical protein
MDGRLARVWQVVVGVTLVSAAVVVVLASTDPSWPVPGVSTLAALAGVFVAGFTLAAILRVLAGEHDYGVGNLLAVIGWILLLFGELFESEAATVGGIAVVLAAGSYLVWLALD